MHFALRWLFFVDRFRSPVRVTCLRRFFFERRGREKTRKRISSCLFNSVVISRWRISVSVLNHLFSFLISGGRVVSGTFVEHARKKNLLHCTLDVCKYIFMPNRLKDEVTSDLIWPRKFPSRSYFFFFWHKLNEIDFRYRSWARATITACSRRLRTERPESSWTRSDDLTSIPFKRPSATSRYVRNSLSTSLLKRPLFHSSSTSDGCTRRSRSMKRLWRAPTRKARWKSSSNMSWTPTPRRAAKCAPRDSIPISTVPIAEVSSQLTFVRKKCIEM